MDALTRRTSRALLGRVGVVALSAVAMLALPAPARALQLSDPPSEIRAGVTLRVTLVSARKEPTRQCTVATTGFRRTFSVAETQTAQLALKLNRRLRNASYRVRLRCSDHADALLDVRVNVPRKWRDKRRRAPVQAAQITVRARAESDCARVAAGECDDPPPTLAERLQALSPRVVTWTDALPIDLTSGRVALLHYWGGCPTCTGDPRYEQIQSWADAHPDVRVVAVSCLDSFHESWLQAHPSWTRPHGFPILVRDAGDGEFRTCVDQHFAHFGLTHFYATQAFLEDGRRVFDPDWSAGWPTPNYA